MITMRLHGYISYILFIEVLRVEKHQVGTTHHHMITLYGEFLGRCNQ
jgi:hypothetical protein